jgi:hypothetical protein
MALATAQKGSSTVADYISNMKTLTDDMIVARKKLDDEELASYVLAGLDYEYNSLVSSIAARVEPITFTELYSQLIAFKTRLYLQGQGSGGQSSVNNASKGRGGFSRGCGGFSKGAVVTVLVIVRTLVVVGEETSPSRRTSSLLDSCVDAQIIPFLNATNGLIRHTWVKTRVQTQLIHMVLIPTGMQTQEQRTMSPESSTSLP